MSEGNIERAILSVYDKEGIVDLARGLAERGCEIISSGGTFRHLKEAGIEVRTVEEITLHPEVLDGRVKTMHPRIHAGVLAKRSLPEHMATLDELGIGRIDVVVVNLYPFEKVAADPASTIDQVIENIDIGGPSLIRAAAKNYYDVIVVCDPADYPNLLQAIGSGTIPDSLKASLARKAFEHTAKYDIAIADWFAANIDKTEGFPEIMFGAMRFRRPLRYGENPHQPAALYERRPDLPSFLDSCDIIQGKELSYNNLLDVDGALGILSDFEDVGCCTVLKHTNPVGLATGEHAKDIFIRAREGDSLSAFGGVIAFNIEVDEDAAEEICAGFYEIVIAPSFADKALKRFKKKKNWRIITTPFTISGFRRKELEMKDLQLGVLVQGRDYSSLNPGEWKCVTKREPTSDEREALSIGWKVVKHVKSNAIVVSKPGEILGIGMGQPSRIDASGIAIKKAGEAVKGAALASDAFFPFSDNVELAADAGITAIVQPGGSMRDQDSIDAADKLGIAMMFTGERHFRH